MILGDAVVEMGVRHQTQFLEKLERPIDRRDVDLGELRRDLGVDRLG